VDSLTRSNLNKSCVVCGALPAEMHHVRKLRELEQGKHLDWFTFQMAPINRKLVPLCRDHYQKLHLGTLTQEKRGVFRKGCKELVSK
jgi:hypothetical protein